MHAISLGSLPTSDARGVMTKRGCEHGTVYYTIYWYGHLIEHEKRWTASSSPRLLFAAHIDD
jgi:hypothetical protein